MPSLQTAMSEPSLRVSQPAIRVRQAVVAGATIVAALTGVVLRWFHLGRQSLWLDEGHTEYVSRLSPGDGIRFLAQTSAHPPLYFLLEHYWRALFGDSEFALRSLSAIFGTLSFPIFYLLAKKVLKDSTTVALAMWLFAFSVTQVWYSQEARPYELPSFLLLGALYALILFLEKRSAVLFATILLCVTASIYMQNMMIFYLLALNVVWLTFPSERTLKQHVGEIALLDILTALLYLPWTATLLRQIALVHASFWVPRPTVRTLLLTGPLIAGFYLDYLELLAARLLPLPAHALHTSVLAGAHLLSAALIARGILARVEGGKGEKCRTTLVLHSADTRSVCGQPCHYTYIS